MRTGFKVQNPEDFSRDYDEELCNISFETQLSNYAKHQYSENMYPAILADIQTIPFKSEWYTRPTSPVPSITIVPMTPDYQEEDDADEDGDETTDDELTEASGSDESDSE